MDTEQARIAELGAENAALKEELKNANNRSFCATEAHVAAQQEIAALKKRLEVSDEHGWDGIACRDETIRVAEKQLLAVQQENTVLKEALKNANDRSFCSTEAHVVAQHRIRQLREALENEHSLRLGYYWRKGYQIESLADKALSTPDNTPELDALVRDAARYRFIRDVPYTDDIKRTIRLQLNEIMDERIDAAMKETPKC